MPAHLLSSNGPSSFSVEAAVLGNSTGLSPHFPDCSVILPLTSGTTCRSPTDGTSGTRGPGEYVVVNGGGGGGGLGVDVGGRGRYVGRGV